MRVVLKPLRILNHLTKATTFAEMIVIDTGPIKQYSQKTTDNSFFTKCNLLLQEENKFNHKFLKQLEIKSYTDYNVNLKFSLSCVKIYSARF